MRKTKKEKGNKEGCASDYKTFFLHAYGKCCAFGKRVFGCRSEEKSEGGNNWDRKAEKMLMCEEGRVSRVSGCLPATAQSSAHTGGESGRAAWSSWQSSPGLSAPQRGHWPPPAEPGGMTPLTLYMSVTWKPCGGTWGTVSCCWRGC